VGMIINPYVFKYVTSAVKFDGTNDYLSKATELTGLADGKKGILSVWLRINGGDAAGQIIVEGGGSGLMGLQRQTTNKFVVDGYNAAVANILRMTSATSYITSTTWRHLLCSWDLSIGAAHMYVNDINDLAGGATILNDTIDYTSGSHYVGARADASRKLNADIADLYVNYAEYLDLSVTANRRKFIDESGKPVDVGADGSGPTGTAPVIFLKGSPFATNRGTGGGFTTTGALTGTEMRHF
jgi:hypothetical protein